MLATASEREKERDKMGDDGGNHAGVRASALVDVLPLSGTQERRQEMTDTAVVVESSRVLVRLTKRWREGSQTETTGRLTGKFARGSRRLGCTTPLLLWLLISTVDWRRIEWRRPERVEKRLVRSILVGRRARAADEREKETDVESVRTQGESK